VRTDFNAEDAKEAPSPPRSPLAVLATLDLLEEDLSPILELALDSAESLMRLSRRPLG
jgi:hypothetical protein